MKYLYYILVIVFFTNCKESNIDESVSKIVELTKKEIPFPETVINELNQYLNSKSQDSLLIHFYKKKTKFIWFNSMLELNHDAKRLIKLLNNSNSYGIDTSHYEITKLNRLLDDNETSSVELLLTHNYRKFGSQISHGQIEDISDYYKFDRRVIDTNWLQILDSGVLNNSIIEGLLSLQPKNEEYVRLQKGLERYLNRVVLSDSIIKVEDRKKDSAETYKTAAKALVLHGVLKSDSVIDSLLIDGVKRFQYEHGLTEDGVVGKGTAKELSRSTNYYYNQAKIALEKWRWTKDFDQEHIFVNIATYKLKCYKNYKLNYEKRVVVGTNETRTPELDSKLDYMIAYPYWYVPRSIIEGELVAKAKKDSTYLARNGYELFKNSSRVNSNNIDWSNGSNYKFRQKGGKSNALGVIKFIFPNRSAVYFHDTPSKRFFAKGRRSFSHGCIRVQDPLELANYFLENDSVNKYSIENVKTFIENETRKVITLNKKIPIYLRYYATEADSENNIRFYPDVYFIEKEILKKIL